MSSRMSILLRDLDSTLKEFDTGAAGQPTKTPSARKGVLGHGAEDDSEDILNQYDHEDDFDILNQYDDTVEEPEALKEQNPPKPLINTPPPLSMPRHTPRPPTSAMAIARAKQLPPTPPQHHLRDPRAFPMPSPTLPPSTQVTNGFHVGESEFVAPVTRNNSSPDSMPLTSVRPAEPVDVAVLREQLERAKFELYKESLANHSLKQPHATLVTVPYVAPTPGPSIVTPVSPATPSQAFSSTPTNDKSDTASVSSDKSGKSSGWFGRSNSQSSKASSKAPAPSPKSPAKKEKATARMLRAQTTIDLDMF